MATAGEFWTRIVFVVRRTGKLLDVARHVRVQHVGDLLATAAENLSDLAVLLERGAGARPARRP